MCLHELVGKDHCRPFLVYLNYCEVQYCSQKELVSSTRVQSVLEKSLDGFWCQIQEKQE